MYTKIHDRIWSMFKREGFTCDEKILYIYLFSCPHRTLLGLYKLPLAYIAEDLGFSVSVTKKLMDGLENKKMIEYDAANSLVLVKKFLECNEVPNKNVEKKAVKFAESGFPDTPLLDSLLLEVAPYKGKLHFLFETILKRYCKQYEKPYEEQYAKWYGNTEAESRKQNTEAESRKQKEAGKPALAAADGVNEYFDLSAECETAVGELTGAQKEKLLEYTGALGVDVVRMAIDRAVQNGARSWGYVDKILSSWLADGLTTPAAVAEDANRFRARRGVQQDGRYQAGEADQRAREDMERLREFMRAKKGGDEDA